MEIIVRCVKQNDYITGKQIAELIRNAHSVNQKINLLYGTRNVTGSQIDEKICSDKSEVFVAISGDKIIGTGTVTIRKCDKWFFSCEAAYIELAAVDPTQRGQHIFQKILDAQFKWISKLDLNLIYSVSAEENISMKKIFLKNGFKIVAYGAGKSNNFYSVYYAKWIKKCPYREGYLKIRFLMDKIGHILVYKKGGKRRI